MEVIAHSTYTVNYASRRSEVWRWYWRAWAKPAGLWRVHVLFGVTCAIVFTVFRNPKSFDLVVFLGSAAVYTLGFIVLLPLWPQIRFKAAVRSLSINPQGLTTSIGKISASRLWNEVKSVDERDGAVVITGRNQNAFIVPSRAFSSDLKRREFYEAARLWCAQANGWCGVGRESSRCARCVGPGRNRKTVSVPVHRSIVWRSGLCSGESGNRCLYAVVGGLGNSCGRDRSHYNTCLALDMEKPEGAVDL
jgi:hypothetical protein